MRYSIEWPGSDAIETVVCDSMDITLSGVAVFYANGIANPVLAVAGWKEIADISDDE